MEGVYSKQREFTIIMKLLLSHLLVLFFLTSCGNKNNNSLNELDMKMNKVAEEYVKLVLEIGLYKPDYVDAYYGPDDWLPEKPQSSKIDPNIIKSLNEQTDNLLNSLEGLRDYKATELETLRFRFLYKQLLSVKGMIFIISGGTFPFDQEAKILYDAEPPQYSNKHFQNIIDELNKIVPGKGNLQVRLYNFRNQFIIPPDKLDTVFTTAINECRRRSARYIQLPQKENFKVEYVKDKSWGAYNWYKGNSYSVIQVNTDLPTYIDGAINLAAHEGYPGHHVFNTLMEKNFVHNNGWMEFSVYPLYSPVSLLAEGTANFGIDVVFPGNERIKFEREVLFPLTGLDTNKVELYYKIMNLLEDLDYAGNEAARNFLDGKWDKEQTIKYMEDYQLVPKERAEKKLDFIKQYRSYVINYNLGEDLVKNYIEKNGGTVDNPQRRWQLFKELLSKPETPSGLE